MFIACASAIHMNFRPKDQLEGAKGKVIWDPSDPKYDKEKARVECFMQANENVITDGSMHFKNGTDLDCDTMTAEEAPQRLDYENDSTYAKVKNNKKI